MKFIPSLKGKFSAIPSRQVTFSVIAGGLSLATLAFVIYVSVFLARHVRDGFSVPERPSSISAVRFDLQAYEALQLKSKP